MIDLSFLTAAQGFIIQGDAANDRAGYSVSSAGDVNGDGIDDLIVGAPFGDGGGTAAGEAYVIYGVAGATRGTLDLSTLTAAQGFVIQGDVTNDNAGRSVSSAGDVNGDGIDDLIIGAFGGDDGGSSAGEAYVIYGVAGATRGTVDLTGLTAAQGFIIQGDAAGDNAGRSVSSAGDVNGDGIDDLIVGAPFGDDGGDFAGEAYVIYGEAGATRGTVDLTGLAASDGFIIRGDAAYDNAGRSVSSAGDVNGDGIDDLIVGAPFGDDGGANAGEAYVIYGVAGSTRGTVDLSFLTAAQGFIIQGDAAGDRAGYSVSSAGDVNGDGIDDLIVGAPVGDDGGEDAGEAYVIYGVAGATRGTLDLSSLTAAQGFIIRGDATEDRAGYSVSSAGDVNGDGIEDLIVGAPVGDDGGANAGEAYVIYGEAGSTRGTLDLSTLTAAQGFIIQGDAAFDSAGSSVSSAGDVNGDGIDDLIVGAPRGHDGGDDAGEAYVIYGSRPTTAVTRTGTDIGQAIFGGDLTDTLNGMGGNDTLDGGGGADTLDGGTGIDRASYRHSTAGVSVDLLTGTNTGGEAEGDVLISIENVTGSAHGDVLTGDGGNNSLSGLDGDDTLSGGDGNDSLAGGAGADSLDGGDGIDRAYYTRSSEGVSVNLSTGIGTGGDAEGDVLVSIENVTGSDHDDLLTGDDGDNLLSGGDGNDNLSGGDGNDSLTGGAGSDTLDGGDGIDRAYYTFSSEGVSVNLLTGIGAGGDAEGDGLSSIENLTGSAHADTLTGDGGNNVLSGAAGRDTIRGGEGDDTIFGGSQNDLIAGNGGNDALYGGSGVDRMFGGAGDDTIYGGRGSDALAGGAGSDVFVFDTAIGTDIDTITDFSVANDTIWLDNAIFTGLLAGALADDAFTVNITGEASSADHRLIYRSDTGALFFDADGTGAGARVQFATLGTGLALTAADFFVV